MSDEEKRISKVLPDVFDLRKYSGIPTTYRGTEFRSRTEARYAAFFDQCGWPWVYEPFDLAGWIPDFALGPKGVLVEIKPFSQLGEWDEAIQKIIHSGCNQPVVLFGNSPTLWIEQQTDFAPEVGWLWEPGEFPVTWTLNYGWTEGNDKLGLCSLEGGWWNIIWTPPPGHSHPNKWSRVHLANGACEKYLVEKWATACNLTKWKPPYDRHGFR